MPIVPCNVRQVPDLLPIRYHVLDDTGVGPDLWRDNLEQPSPQPARKQNIATLGPILKSQPS